MTRKTNRIDFPPTIADDGERRRGPRGLAVRHQHRACAEQAPIKIGFPVPLTGPFGAEAKEQVAPRRDRGQGIQRRRRLERPHGGTAGARRQAESRRGRDAHPRTDRKGKSQFRRRLAVGCRAALDQQRDQGTRRHLQLDQPVGRDQRGQGLQQLHLPRGAQPAHDFGGGRALRVSEVRQARRLPDRRLRLRARDAARLPRASARSSASKRSATCAIRSAPATTRRSCRACRR